MGLRNYNKRIPVYMTDKLACSYREYEFSELNTCFLIECYLNDCNLHIIAKGGGAIFELKLQHGSISSHVKKWVHNEK